MIHITSITERKGLDIYTLDELGRRFKARWPKRSKESLEYIRELKNREIMRREHDVWMRNYGPEYEQWLDEGANNGLE
jgi:hypothetical protein